MRTKKAYYFFIFICILQLFYLLYYRSDFNYEILKNPFHIDSGREYAVSLEVQESNQMLNDNGVNSFKLSNKIKNDTYLYQRFIEYNYPKKEKNKALLTFYLINEKMLNSCILFSEGTSLKLAKC